MEVEYPCALASSLKKDVSLEVLIGGSFGVDHQCKKTSSNFRASEQSDMVRAH